MTLSNETIAAITRAAEIVAGSDAILVCAGAGMSADSGLATFRDGGGLWTMTTKVGTKAVSFTEVAQPKWFHYRPEVAWGFYGWRLGLYQEAAPHVGHDILKKWGAAKARGTFVLTSNVDGLFTKAGVDAEQLLECHGSIHLFQCRKVNCGSGLWPASTVRVKVDGESITAEEPFPKCPRCGRVARPNILMFDDANFLHKRHRQQSAGFERWLAGCQKGSLVVLEIGAGTAVPTVRRIADAVVQNMDAWLVRINLHDLEPVPPAVGATIGLGAAEALTAIDAAFSGSP